jgi:hypothetical protein
MYRYNPFHLKNYHNSFSVFTTSNDMKSFACVLCAGGAAVAADVISDLDALRAEFALIKAETKEMSALYNTTKDEMLALRTELAEKIATRTDDDYGQVYMFVDGRDACPDGMNEVKIARGSLLLGAPGGLNGTCGRQIGIPMTASEVGRTGPHQHDVSVDVSINDPGHTHSVPPYFDTKCRSDGHTEATNPGGCETPWIGTYAATTGITASATGSVATHDGEFYPLLYVLVCEKAK